MILVEGEEAPKYSVCVNCLERVERALWETYDHCCEECYEKLNPIVDGTGRRMKD